MCIRDIFNHTKRCSQNLSFKPSQLVLVTFWSGPCVIAVSHNRVHHAHVNLHFGLSFNQLISKHFYIGYIGMAEFFLEWCHASYRIFQDVSKIFKLFYLINHSFSYSFQGVLFKLHEVKTMYLF